MFSKLIEKIHLIHYHPTRITQMPIFYEKIIKHFNSITIFYEKICFYAKHKANLRSQKKGVTETPHFVFKRYSNFRILRLALSITSVFKEAR